MSQKLRGFIGQGMDGRKATRSSLVAMLNAVVSSSYTPTQTVQLFIVATGAGGHGIVNGSSGGGGGGGGAGLKKWILSAGQTIQWTIGVGGATSGAPGGDTVVIIPGLGLLTAGGGQGGVSQTIGGAGGSCAGPWDLIRAGGGGGAGASATAGVSPFGGGIGGTPSSGFGGGGAAAGFTDLIAGTALPGNGAQGNTSVLNNTAPGGATGGSSLALTPGKDGSVIIVAVTIDA